MKKALISELKNRLSHYLRFVRRGESVLVYDRDRAIARIDPVRSGLPAGGEPADWTDALPQSVLRPPTTRLPADWLDRRVRAECDVVAALLAEREGGR